MRAPDRPSGPFPVPFKDPPHSRPIRGLVCSGLGTVLIIAGFLGAGLLANGALGVVIALTHREELLFSWLERNNEFRGRPELLWKSPPTGNTLLVLSLTAMCAGGLVSAMALGEGARLRDLGRRLRARDARALLTDAAVRPVVVLRSFRDDELADPRPVDFFQPRYEESLARALARLGPAVAIGRPGEGHGFLGAARLYVADEDWRPAVLALLARATAVVIIVGKTEGLWWEIGTALEAVPRDRLLFFFPFVQEHAGRSGSRLSRSLEFIGRWNLPRRRFLVMQEERRRRFHDFVRRTGLDLGRHRPEECDRAQFLDFLPDGQVRLLQSRQASLWQSILGLENPLLVLLTPRRFGQARLGMARTIRPFVSKLQGHLQ